MLWDYVYIGSEIVRSAMEDVVGTWPTGEIEGTRKNRVKESVPSVRRNRQTMAGTPQNKDKSE